MTARPAPPTSASVPKLIFLAWAPMPLPSTKVKNARTRIVITMMTAKERDGKGAAGANGAPPVLGAGLHGGNSRKEPSTNDTMPPAVRKPCVGVFRSTRKSATARRMKTIPPMFVGRLPKPMKDMRRAMPPATPGAMAPGEESSKITPKIPITRRM